MKEYIEREAAVNEIGRWLGYLDEDMILRIQIGLNKIPTADVRENVRGEWIEEAYGYIHCSLCGTEGDEPEQTKTNFCPGCGADMRKEQT